MLIKIPYRNDIEGLRGVAVLLVIAYHLRLPPITGGFIGVDIFYVISGFLITSIIIREPVTRLALLVDFYNRRIKRLLPTYLFVLGVTTACCVFFMLPDDLLSYLKSVRESFLLRSNHFFQAQLANYFAPDADELPLLHTWSLSIEWQYYLVFPAAFLVIKRLVGERRLFPVVLALAGILILVGMFGVRRPENAYFSAVSRSFEFLLGSVAAVAKTKSPGRTFAHTVGALSIASLLSIAVVFTSKTPFPGINALVVCMLSVLPIMYGENSAILSNRWIVYVGKRSYSLYLWHWPIVALISYLQLRRPPYVNALLLVAIFLLSEFTYVFVERPYIRREMSLGKSFSLFVALPLALTVVALYLAREFDGFPQRLGVEFVHAYKNTKEYARETKGCDDFSGWGLSWWIVTRIPRNTLGRRRAAMTSAVSLTPNGAPLVILLPKIARF